VDVRLGGWTAFLWHSQSEVIVFAFVPRSRSIALMVGLCATLVACSDDPVAPPTTENPKTSVSVSYCAATAPVLVAFRDGDGDWERATPTGGERTTFGHEFTSERAAMVSVTPVFDGQFTVVRIAYAKPSELAAEGDTLSTQCISAAPKTFRGTLAGVDETQSAIVSVGPFGRTFVQPLLSLDFSIADVPDGPQDLLAIRNPRGESLTRLILRRDLDLPNGSVLPTLDFGSPEAFDVIMPSVTLENLRGEPAVTSTTLITRRASFALPLPPNANANITQSYVSLPADKLIDGDLEQLHASTGGPTFRTTDVFYREPSNRTVRLGDPMTAPTVMAVATEPSVRPRARFDTQPDYDQQTFIVYEQPARPTFVVVSMTAAYAARSGGYELEVPDLSSVPGFDPQWTLRPGLFTSWTASRLGGTVPVGRGIPPVDGATRRAASVQGTVTMP
jgi:hypothetical protein